MEAQPLVSIVLPAFNSEKTVGEAIASIVQQTYQNWEMIFIDDGSSDLTAEVARRFNDPRIKIFVDGKNKGLPARLNEAIDLSAGKYFARMDNDDLAFPERLEKQVNYLEAHGEIDLLATKAITFITPGETTGLFPFRGTHEEICRQPWNGFYMPHPTWMGRLEWFRKHRYRSPGVNRAEDQELLLRSYPSSRFACLPEVLFAYRVRPRVSLKINMAARKSLLVSQLEIFVSRKEWGYAALAVLSYWAKVAKDVLSWLTRRKVRPNTRGIEEYLPRWQALKDRVRERAR